MTIASASRPIIVLVDDDAQVLQVLRRYLERAFSATAFELITTVSAQFAYETCHKQPVRLLICDYLMPDMNGLQLTRLVKATSPATQVVLITGLATPNTISAAHQAGIDSVLAKPFTLPALSNALNTLLHG